MRQEDKDLRYRIERPVNHTVPPSGDLEGSSGQVNPTEKFLIRRIVVSGATLFPEAVIKAITSLYENRACTLADAQALAGRLTDLYRKKGYVTSRAYIPAQKMNDGVLQIRVMESTTGDIRLQGNRYFSTPVLQRYINTRHGSFFKYNDISHDLANLNRHPDREVRAILMSGNGPGTTDIHFEVKDVRPVHVSLEYNNYLSRFVGRNGYNTTVTHNNLLGRDDLVQVQYQRGDAGNYSDYSARYVYPLTTRLDLGFLASRSKLLLGREYASVAARGESRMLGVYCDQNLLRTENFVLGVNFGLDYKNVNNYLFKNISSQDRLRVLKAGSDLDLVDDLGRTFISNEFDYWLAGLWQGTKEHPEPSDIPSSRYGARGSFCKDALNLVRLQKLVYDATLLWKTQIQFSPSVLTATEQFQVGGPANNRGYTPGEFTGDRGFATTWEIGMPLYFVPVTWKVPGSRNRMIDALRLVSFYDVAQVYSNTSQANDPKNRLISSCGGGLRLNVIEGVSARYEIGWPLDKRPADGKAVHQWLEITVTF